MADFLSFFCIFPRVRGKTTMLGGRSLIRILGPMGIPLWRAGRLPALGTVLYNSISRVLYSESLLFLFLVYGVQSTQLVLLAHAAPRGNTPKAQHAHGV